MSRLDARAADEALAGIANRLPPVRRRRPRPIANRMADVITRTLSMNSNVTHDDLVRAGFEDADITRHFRAALRQARAEHMVG